MNIDSYWTPTVFQACHTLAVIESPLSPARQIWLSSFAMWGGWCSLRLHRSPQVTQLGSKKGNAAQAQSICHPCLCTHRFDTRAPGDTTTAASSPHILEAFLPRRWASTSEPPWNVCLPALQIPTEQVLDFLLRSKVPLFFMLPLCRSLDFSQVSSLKLKGLGTRGNSGGFSCSLTHAWLCTRYP